MKIAAKHVRFVPVMPWFARRRLRLIGRANTIQLLETALVIEGLEQTIGLFLIDLLFRGALSEWTTVTVPYSRIVRFKYSRQWLARIVFGVLVGGPVAFLAVGAAFAAAQGGAATLMMIPFLIALFCVALY